MQNLERIATDIDHRLSSHPDTLAYLHQATVVATHDAYERLNQVGAPTLVVHGEQDIFMPPANALVLAERIPGAQLQLWPDAGHLYMIDEPKADLCDRTLPRGIQSVSPVSFGWGSGKCPSS